jgi:hypothetical protein
LVREKSENGRRESEKPTPARARQLPRGDYFEDATRSAEGTLRVERRFTPFRC